MKQFFIQGLLVVILLLRTDVSGYRLNGCFAVMPLLGSGITCTRSRGNVELYNKMNQGSFSAIDLLGVITGFCFEIDDIIDCTNEEFTECDHFQQVYDANAERRNLCNETYSWITDYLVSLGDGQIFDGTCVSDVVGLIKLCNPMLVPAAMAFDNKDNFGSNPFQFAITLVRQIQAMGVTCLTTMSYTHPDPENGLKPECQNMNPKVAALLLATVITIQGPPGSALSRDQFEQIKNMP